MKKGIIWSLILSFVIAGIVAYYIIFNFDSPFNFIPFGLYNGFLRDSSVITESQFNVSFDIVTTIFVYVLMYLWLKRKFAPGIPKSGTSKMSTR